MEISKLSAADKRLLYASIGVIFGGVIGIIDRWGVGSIVGGLAGLGAAGVILQPQMAPTMKLPAPKATLMVVLGGVAAGGFILSTLQYLQWIFDNLADVSTLLFGVGLVAAIVLAYFAWMDYKGMQAPSAPTATPEPPAPPADVPGPPAES